MNARDSLQIIQIVVQDSSALRIADLLSADDPAHFETALAEGESFGGRIYAEWLAIARGPGRIDADWLRV